MIHADRTTRPGRVLVVEDQRHLARFLQYVLEGAGYEVSNSYDGEQALSEIDRFQPDALVLDLVLPGISGLEVLRRLRADRRTRKLVIVAMTPGRDRALQRDLREAGADAICGKPIVPLSLLEGLWQLAVPPRIGPPERIKVLTVK